jgi:hypothetical protein
LEVLHGVITALAAIRSIVKILETTHARQPVRIWQNIPCMRNLKLEIENTIEILFKCERVKAGNEGNRVLVMFAVVNLIPDFLETILRDAPTLQPYSQWHVKINEHHYWSFKPYFLWYPSHSKCFSSQTSASRPQRACAWMDIHGLGLGMGMGSW